MSKIQNGVIPKGKKGSQKIYIFLIFFLNAFYLKYKIPTLKINIMVAFHNHYEFLTYCFVSFFVFSELLDSDNFVILCSFNKKML